MNEQHNNPNASMDLPVPYTEQGSARDESGSTASPGELLQNVALETGSVSSGPPPVTVQSQHPTVGDGSALAQQIGATTTRSQGMPAIADDVDLIEREWVHKAKEIVEHTKGDPHAQNKEMNKAKADYLKKRYNKDLKLEEK